ncbi:hypothetical protein J3Q64DRAFT_1182515 [Phycomyces blakesleeanus]|uniref:BTB domain-containing protein n=1 Tax=Phycomyces blakesleeanus TaxID=4837 RepID=A0ABR3AUA5_PHYBL
MVVWPSSYGPPNISVVLGNPADTQNADTGLVSRHLSLSLFRIPVLQAHRRLMSSVPQLGTLDAQKDGSVLPCHRSVLVAHSSYFAALLEGDFQESQMSTVYLPHELSDAPSIKTTLEFMYDHKLRLSCSPAESLKLLQTTYLVADYLDIPLLKQALLDEWNKILHNWTCNCPGCSSAVPLVLQFARQYPHDEHLEAIHKKIYLLLTHDPDKALAAFWTEKSLATLLLFDKHFAQSLHMDIISRIGQHNAIESLFACFSAAKQLATKDPLFNWSEPLHITLAAAEARATKIIATHFDFYCSSYPALLSCIDGVTYSFDFLEYLLNQILEDEMDCTNAGVLYQGIVRDLMGRQEVQSHERVSSILQGAKYQILCFVADQFDQVKQTNHLNNLDSDILQQLAKVDCPTTIHCTYLACLKPFQAILFVFFLCLGRFTFCTTSPPSSISTFTSTTLFLSRAFCVTSGELHKKIVGKRTSPKRTCDLLKIHFDILWPESFDL